MLTISATPPIDQPTLAGLGIVAAFALTALVARRDRASVGEAFALLGLCGVAALGGGRLLNLVAGMDGMSSAGAIAGAGLVVVVHRVTFGRATTLSLLDVAAPGGLLALASARIGCLFEGCHVGLPGGGILSVKYEAAHPVWQLHALTGLAEGGSSAAVHPYALYVALPSIALVLASIWLAGGRGLRVAAIVVGYALVRIVAEFFRDSSVDASLGAPVGAGVALVAVVTVLVWVRRGANVEETNPDPRR